MEVVEVFITKWMKLKIFIEFKLSTIIKVILCVSRSNKIIFLLF